MAASLPNYTVKTSLTAWCAQKESRYFLRSPRKLLYVSCAVKRSESEFSLACDNTGILSQDSVPKDGAIRRGLYCTIPRAVPKAERPYEISTADTAILARVSKETSEAKPKQTSKPAKQAEEVDSSFGLFLRSKLGALTSECQRIADAIQVRCSEELIYDLRVALRRLKSAVNSSSAYSDLPQNAVSEVSKILSLLGPLRDADVMQKTLEKVEAKAVGMSSKEKTTLEEVRKLIAKQRKKMSKKAAELVSESPNRKCLKAIKKWRKNPQFRQEVEHVASYSLAVVAPSILLPLAAVSFLHPGWQIDDVFIVSPNDHHSDEKGPLKPRMALNVPLVERIHDLRKTLRDLRYNMELLSPSYESRESFSANLVKVKGLQSILGQIQDLQVLSTYLEENRTGGTPSLENAISESLQEVWVAWIESRDKFLSAKKQQKFYRSLSSPAIAN